jgi:hypothetical protein
MKDSGKQKFLRLSNAALWLALAAAIFFNLTQSINHLKVDVAAVEGLTEFVSRQYFTIVFLLSLYQDKFSIYYLFSHFVLMLPYGIRILRILSGVFLFSSLYAAGLLWPRRDYENRRGHLQSIAGALFAWIVFAILYVLLGDLLFCASPLSFSIFLISLMLYHFRKVYFDGDETEKKTFIVVSSLSVLSSREGLIAFFVLLILEFIHSRFIRNKTNRGTSFDCFVRIFPAVLTALLILGWGFVIHTAGLTADRQAAEIRPMEKYKEWLLQYNPATSTLMPRGKIQDWSTNTGEAGENPLERFVGKKDFSPDGILLDLFVNDYGDKEKAAMLIQDETFEPRMLRSYFWDDTPEALKSAAAALMNSCGTDEACHGTALKKIDAFSESAGDTKTGKTLRDFLKEKAATAAERPELPEAK